MPFEKNCASQSLHDNWGIVYTANPNYSTVKAKTRDKLLELCGKSIGKNYPKVAPSFCNSCIGRVSIDFPELSSTPQHTDDDAQPPDKKVCIDEEIPTTSTQTIEETSTTSVVKHDRYTQTSNAIDDRYTHTSNANHNRYTQTSNMFIDVDDMSTLHQLNDQQLETLCYHLGKLLSEKLRVDSLQLTNDKNIELLNNINPVQYLEHRNGPLVKFLLGVKGSETAELNLTNRFILCKTVESIMNLSAGHLLLPFHFRESVVLYSLTGSRLALSLLAGGGPHASYQQVKLFLNNLGTEEEYNMDGDVIFVFDNNQILHRQWTVKIDSKFQCHIITMVVVFEINRSGSLQFKVQEKPGQWMQQVCVAMKSVKYIDQEPEVKRLHYEEHLYPFLTEIIQSVAKDQENVAKDGEPIMFQDQIDKDVEDASYGSQYKDCLNCSERYIPKSKLNCPACKHNLKKSRLQVMGIADRSTYETKVVNRSHNTPRPPKTVRVQVQDKQIGQQGVSIQKMEVDEEPQGTVDHVKFEVCKPVFVNPCSYDSCLDILRDIGKKAGIKKYGYGTREWVSICCDGSPYVLCLRLMLSMYMCDTCGLSMSGISAIDDHIALHEDINATTSYSLEFDWVLLIPGPGHIEMNLLKSLVEFVWDIFWRQMVITLNFKSENAQKAAKRVNDHHKGWSLLRIARNALAKELVLKFVRLQLLKDNTDLSVVNFMRFISRDVKDQNFLLIADIVFEIIDAIYMYRTGVRTGNSSYMHVARAKAAKIWSARHHPSYREIEMADSLSLARMPEAVRDLVMKSSSINTSGNIATNEGADFKLESINKQTQHWVPRVPSGKDWETICCNYNTLTLLRGETFIQMGIQDPKSQKAKKPRDISKEEAAFRVVVRQKQYLTDPLVPKPLLSLDGSPLDPMLPTFSSQAREKRARYFDVYQEYEHSRSFSRTSVPFHESPVFVTPQERMDYEAVTSRTIVQIQAIIVEKLQSISVLDVREVFEESYVTDITKRKAVKKQDYINFLNELNDYLDNEQLYLQEIENMQNSDDDDDD